MNLDAWAQRHGVTPQALAGLRAVFTAQLTDPEAVAGKSEAAIQAQARLEASREGGRLWRNNVGACMTDDGQFVRFGLCNETKALNKSIKSSDLIGLRPVVIEPYMVGATFGQFVAREVKTSGWQYRGTEREAAQLKFLNLVVALGGDGAFVSG